MLMVGVWVEAWGGGGDYGLLGGILLQGMVVVEKGTEKGRQKNILGSTGRGSDLSFYFIAAVPSRNSTAEAVATGCAGRLVESYWTVIEAGGSSLCNTHLNVYINLITNTDFVMLQHS